MEYDFRRIEKEWQKKWKETNAYRVSNDSAKEKYYVLDMFPYPSGAGLHVGHPLGYIASDIYSRYKRLKGFNVLHPMGFDSFGLPAEQYAIETGQHPADTTEKNIATFKAQMDKIGFCYDWQREVRTSDPSYYKWTQWIFLQLFHSFFNTKTNKAEAISELATAFEKEGNASHPMPNEKHTHTKFSADEWEDFDEKTQQEILMEYRLAFSKYGEVNWCEALGTVLANDEVVNGVSERGGHPVEKKKMRQWYLRITDYSDRLLQGLETVDFSDSMKEMQRNWIGKSEGADLVFPLSISPRRGEDKEENEAKNDVGDDAGNHKDEANTVVNRPGKGYAKYKVGSPMSFEKAKQMRKEPTEAENKLWDALRARKIEYKFRRQHPVENFIADFICLDVWLIIELDGEYHNTTEQKIADVERDRLMMEIGFTTLRFTNDEVINNLEGVLSTIKEKADVLKQMSENVQEKSNADQSEQKDDQQINAGGSSPMQGEAGVRVYTTRPDTIFGVDFMVVAPELDMVKEITSAEQSAAVEEYLTYVKSRSDRERMAEVKQITGCFTGAYAINPFDGREIPIWISEYVLAGYGTGAIMAVPCGDQRDYAFAKHFNIAITNIIGSHYNGEEANPTKEATLENSGFLNGLLMKDAIGVALEKIEELGIGKRKVNYRMRDAGFSRQRYWGEPFPIIWSDGVAIPLDAKELPLELPHVDKYGPGPEGEGPLANIKEWTSSPSLLHGVEKGDEKNEAKNILENEAKNLPKSELKGAVLVPKYKVGTALQYEFAKRMRKDFTEAENILWQELRNSKLDVKFRRQHPIENYIADFVCLQKALIIEVDGGYHDSPEQKLYDTERTRLLLEIGFSVLRFTNNEVIDEIKKVLSKIKEELLRSKNHTSANNNESHDLSHPSPRSGEGQGVRETSTMPGYAGSSWYFLRYMDPHNSETFCSRKASDYWNQVDVYIGGTEHAVGHLLYSRLWTKVLYDLGFIGFDEPYKKLVNQGMIQGSSRFVYRINWKFKSIESVFKNPPPTVFISEKYLDYSLIPMPGDEPYFSDSMNKIFDQFQIAVPDLSENFFYDTFRVDVSLVDGVELDINAFKNWKNGEYANAEFILEDGKYICGVETEKMSKSKYNTVNPDDLVDKYGADTFRMYEMFLGPVEASKPWDTKGIEGVHRFLKKLWRLFFDEVKGPLWISQAPSPRPNGLAGQASERAGGEAALKTLHRTIKKIEEDTERFSFNTAVSTFMICVNELSDVKCHNKEILEQMLVLLTPYAPHIAEELWHQLGNEGSILDAAFPVYDPSLLVESAKEYPLSINGKLRSTINLSLDLQQAEVEKLVLENEIVQKWLEGKSPKKIIYVKNKMINVVI